MKAFDNFIGNILALIFPAPKRKEVTFPITSLLLIRPGGIGDAVLLAWAIHFIKKIHPQVCISVLVEHRNEGVFLLVPKVDNVFCYDCPRDFIQVLLGRYDVVIDTEQWHRLSAVVARLVRAPVKIGFATNERLRMFTHSVPYSHEDYEADSFRRLLVPLGIDQKLVDQGAPFLKVPVLASQKAASLLESLGGKAFVVIFPGASIPERRWGSEHFSVVARCLAENEYRVVVVGGREDREQGEIIVGAGGLNLAGLTSLVETAAVIARSRLLISSDSGVLHIAVGLGVPTLSLFGPGIAAKWAPRGDDHIVINKNFPCSPCTRFGYTPKCPINAKCMADITVDEVVDAVHRLIQKLQNEEKEQ